MLALSSRIGGIRHLPHGGFVLRGAIFGIPFEHRVRIDALLGVTAVQVVHVIRNVRPGTYVIVRHQAPHGNEMVHCGNVEVDIVPRVSRDGKRQLIGYNLA